MGPQPLRLLFGLSAALVAMASCAEDLPTVPTATGQATGPLDVEPELIGNLYIGGVKASHGIYVGLEPWNPATADRIVEPQSWSMWADPASYRMWGWSDPKAGGWCGDLTPYLQGDLDERNDEQHRSHPDSEPNGKETHCIRPGAYRLNIPGIKSILLDYLPIVPAIPGQTGALQVWNQTAGVNESLEALDPDDTLNVWADLVVHVDTVPGSYAETGVLSVQNAHDNPHGTSFQDDPNLAGSELDYFRFSAAGSGSQWPGTNDGKALARLYWDFDRSKTQWTTNYYDPLSPDGRIIRLHRFAEHVTGTRQAVVALELMRPDEDPNDTVNVAQRVIQITLTPNSPPTASFTYACDSLTCTFTDASSDPDGTIVSRLWTFGDGDSSTVLNPSHVYAAPDFYDVRLIVTDNGGKADTATQVVPVALVTITGPDWITRPRTYSWNVNVTAGTPPYAYQWWYRPFGPGGEWQLVGTASSYSLYVGYSNLGFTLRCDVSDTAGFFGSDTHLVSTEWGYGPITTTVP